MKLSEPLKFAVVSDIHLGHNRNRAFDIVANLKQAIPDNAETAQLDIIFIAGDVYHTLLQLSDDDVVDIDIWFLGLLSLCKKHNILLRVLEGTHSHDWCQCQRFVALNDASGIAADFRYVKDLSIEYFAQYEMNVLYVPDEWEPKTETTLAQVRELLRAKGLTHVDLAIMHGMFDYQAPPVGKPPVHDSAAYMELVKYLIFVGHVHTHSHYYRIVAQGSFDRIAHGEEEPKGHVRAVLHPNGDHEIRFVENVGAKKFVTIHCVGMDIEETWARIEYALQHLPEQSYVRIKAHPENPILADTTTLAQRYPFYTFACDVVSEKEEKEELRETEELFVPITLTRDNLGSMLLERVVKQGATGETLEACNMILEEVL